MEYKEQDIKLRLEYLTNKIKLSIKEKVEIQELKKLLIAKNTKPNNKEYKNIEQYFDVVESSVNKIYNEARRSGSKAIQPELKEELQQICMVSLLETYNNFDTAKDCSFRTYAWYRVRGALLDYLRSQDTVSRSTRAALKLIKHDDTTNTFSSDVLTQKQVDTAVKKSTIVSQFSMAEDGDTATVMDFADTIDTYSDIEAKETLKSVLKACPLTEREQAIITGHYFDDKRLYDIGKELGITESRISQLHKDTLNKLAKYV